MGPGQKAAGTQRAHEQIAACISLSLKGVVWCWRGELNPHAVYTARDFESRASASSATPACLPQSGLNRFYQHFDACDSAAFCRSAPSAMRPLVANRPSEFAEASAALLK